MNLLLVLLASAAAATAPPTTPPIEPAATSVLSVPVATINPGWVKVTVLTQAMLPTWHKEAVSKLQEPCFTFEKDGDFNNDGRGDKALVGYYRDRQGVVGRFLLILTRSPKGNWEVAFVGTDPEEAGWFSILCSNGSYLEWWPCLECDFYGRLIWKDGRYILIWQGPDTDEP